MMIRQDFNRRHSPNRRKTNVPAIVRADGERMHAVILDISYEGIKLSVPLPLQPGTPVTIEALGAEIPAIIHWHRAGFAGARMLDRLESRVLIALETAEDDLAEYR